MTQNNPIVLFIRGLPGAGKTTVAKELASKVEREFVVLDPDEIDQESSEYQTHVEAMEADGVDPVLHLYRFLRGQAYEAIESGKIIIWNQPFSNNDAFGKIVARLQEHAAAHEKKLSMLIVEVELDAATAKARVDERKAEGGHGPSEEIWQRFLRDYDTFSKDGFETVRVDGNGNVDESVQKILDAIAAIS